MKRKIAILMSFLMLLTMIPIQASAAGLLVTEGEKAKLELVYMEYNDGVKEEFGSLTGGSSTDMNCHPVADIPDLKVGDKFLVGVRVSDLKNIQTVAEGNGLNSIIATVLYDSEYVTAESTSSISNYSPARIGGRGDTNSLFYWDDPYQLNASVLADNSYSGTNRGVTFGVTYPKSTNPRYVGATSQYLVVIGFTVNKIPTDGMGASVFGFETTINSNCTSAFGASGGAGGFEANGAQNNDMLDIFELDASQADIFPAPKQATPITSVTVPTITEPATGAAPTRNITVTGVPGGIASSSIAWTNAAGQTLSSGNFAANTVYTATITVNADTEYQFANDVDITEGWTKAESSTANALVLTKTFDATKKATISSVAVTDITAPSTGATPDTTAIANNRVTPGTVSWTPAVTGGFAAGQEYTASFTLTAPSDSVFSANPTVTVAGSKASGVEVESNGDNTVLTVTATFPATTRDPISAVTLGNVVQPGTGNNVPETNPTVAPGSVVSSTYTANGAAAGATFEGSAVYTQTIVIAPSAGDSFASNVTVNGVTNATNVAPAVNSDGNLVVTITWPITGAKAVRSISVVTQPAIEYEYGQNIDLTRIGVEVTYSDNTKEVLSYAELGTDAAYTIDGNTVENGDPALVAMDGKAITVNYGGQPANTSNLEVAPVTPTLEFVTADLSQRTNALKTPGVTVTPSDDGDVVIEIKKVTEGTPEVPCDNLEGCDPENGIHAEGCNYAAAVAGTETWVPFTTSEIAVAGTYTVRATYEAGTNTNAVTEPVEATLTVTQASSGGSGGGSGMLTVRFDAGVNGKITKGSSTVKVAKNEKLKSSDIPTVTANEGYRFLGWTLDGSKTVDPTKDAVTSSVTYRALYNTGATHGVYMRGDSDGNFYPERNITRAEAAALIARLNANYNEGTKYSSSLTDVASEEWYASAVNFCASSGLITGYDDGTFLPNNQITRQEFCAIVARYLNLNNAGEANFSDIDETIWGAGYISQLAGKGIINGYENGTFAPNAPIKRCEVVKILNGVFDRTPDASTVNDNIGNYSVRIPDISANHWAYYEILEAAVEHDHADFHKN